MALKRIHLAVLLLAGSLASATAATDWDAVGPRASVRAADGAVLRITFVPSRRCSPRVSISYEAGGETDQPLTYQDLTDLAISLQVDDHLAWRADWGAVQQVGGRRTVAIDDFHPDLLTELAAGTTLRVRGDEVPLAGAALALGRALRHCQWTGATVPRHLVHTGE